MHSYAGSRIANSPGFAGDAEAARRFAKGNTLLRSLGDEGFAEVESTPLTLAGWAWGNLLFDYDNDGDLDFYVVNGMFSNVEETDT